MIIEYCLGRKNAYLRVVGDFFFSHKRSDDGYVMAGGRERLKHSVHHIPMARAEYRRESKDLRSMGDSRQNVYRVYDRFAGDFHPKG